MKTIIIKLPDSAPVRSASMTRLAKRLRGFMSAVLGIAADSIEVEVSDE